MNFDILYMYLNLPEFISFQILRHIYIGYSANHLFLGQGFVFHFAKVVFSILTL